MEDAPGHDVMQDLHYIGADRRSFVDATVRTLSSISCLDEMTKVGQDLGVEGLGYICLQLSTGSPVEESLDEFVGLATAQCLEDGIEHGVQFVGGRGVRTAFVWGQRVRHVGPPLGYGVEHLLAVVNARDVSVQVLPLGGLLRTFFLCGVPATIRNK